MPLNALAPSHLIGPNAIIQMIKAMEEGLGVNETLNFFIKSKLGHYISHPLMGRVHEQDVCLIHQRLIETYGIDQAKQLTREAGLRTADHLLKNRIPKLFGFFLRHLPTKLSIALLLRAISNHPWTFVGSGKFSYQVFSTITIYIESKPICKGILSTAPICDYYAGTFEGLLKSLINATVKVQEVGCEARGDPVCSFRVSWLDRNP